jgi:hypothetical protein
MTAEELEVRALREGFVIYRSGPTAMRYSDLSKLKNLLLKEAELKLNPQMQRDRRSQAELAAAELFGIPVSEVPERNRP